MRMGKGNHRGFGFNPLAATKAGRKGGMDAKSLSMEPAQAPAARSGIPRKKAGGGSKDPVAAVREGFKKYNQQEISDQELGQILVDAQGRANEQQMNEIEEIIMENLEAAQV